MNKKEKALSLRIINELIKSYTKICILPTNAVSLTPSQAAPLTPSWLVNIKKELILGKYLRLPDVIEKIRATLEDCLRGLGPLLTVFSRVLLNEQILEYEIKKLPRSLKNEYRSMGQKNNSNKPTTLTMKRRADKKHFTLQSHLMNDVMEAQDSLKDGHISESIQPAVDSEAVPQLDQTSRMESGTSNMKKKGKRQNNNENDKKTKVCKSKKNISTNVSSVANLPKRKLTKTVNASKNKRGKQEKSKRVKVQKSAPCTMDQKPSKLKNPLTTASKQSLVSKPETKVVPKKTQPRKRKENTNETNSTATNKELEKTIIPSCAVSLRRVAVGNVGKKKAPIHSEPRKKQKQITYKKFSQRLRNLVGKPKPSKNLHSEITIVNEQLQELLPSGNCEKHLPTGLGNITTSTPNKHLNSSSENDVVADHVEAQVDSSDIQIRICNMQSGKEDTENFCSDEMNTTPREVILEGSKKDYKIPNTIKKRKFSSKFQQKGNQLMGIEENHASEPENGKEDTCLDTQDNMKHMEIHDVEQNGEAYVTSAMDVENSTRDTNKDQVQNRSKTARSARPCKISKRAKKNLTKNKPQDDTVSLAMNDVLPTHDTMDDSEPEVVRVVTRETYAKIKRKILRMLDTVEGNDSDVRIEKVIINETITDDEEENVEQTMQKCVPLCLESQKTDSIDQENRSDLSSCSNQPTLDGANYSITSPVNKSRIGKKKLVKMYGQRRMSNMEPSDLNDESMEEEPTVSSCPDAPMTIIDQNRRAMAEQWENNELMPYGNCIEELTHMPEIPEISCFLHACQRALHLPFFTHFEFERSLIVPHASCLMATVVTALLSGVPSNKETKTCCPLPYLQWNRKLTARISHWFLVHKRLKSDPKVQELIGVEPNFWRVLGYKRSPLSLKPFHLLPFHQRVILLKGLCDHLFHVSKRIQTALLSTPRGGREGKWLGEDGQGARYLHIPIFLHHGLGDLRIYKLNIAEIAHNLKEEQLEEEQLETNEKLHLKKEHNSVSEADGMETSINETDRNYSNHHQRKSFCLVADSIEKLNALVSTISSPFLKEELIEAEAKLSVCLQKVKIEEECLTTRDTSDQGSVTMEEKEHESVEMGLNAEDPSPRNEHLHLAAKLLSLARNLNSMEDILNKSRGAAIVKLHMEWTEYNKDGFRVAEEDSISEEKDQSKTGKNSYKTEKKNDNNEKSEELTASEKGEKQIPTRKSLSRRAKLNAGILMQQEDARPSRKDVVAEMEEKALLGCTNLTEEERKWDVSLWADEDSDDDYDKNIQSEVEESIWYGYAAIQGDPPQNEPPLQLTSTTNRKFSPFLTRKQPRIKDTTIGQKSLLMGRKHLRIGLPSQQNSPINNDATVIKTESVEEIQNMDEIQILSEKYNGIRLNAYKIKIKKEDLDMCLSKSEPVSLVDLVRRNMPASNHCVQSMDQHTAPHSSTSNGHPKKLNDIIEIEEINPSQSLTESLLKSLKLKRENSENGSFGSPASTSTTHQSNTVPLKIVKLKMPLKKDKSGKASVYSKHDMDHVTKMILKTVKEMNILDRKDSTKNLKTSGSAQMENRTCETDADDEDAKPDLKYSELCTSNEYEKIAEHQKIACKSQPLLRDNKHILRSSFDDNSADISEPENVPKERVTRQHSGFKPFPLKALRISKNSSD